MKKLELKVPPLLLVIIVGGLMLLLRQIVPLSSFNLWDISVGISGCVILLGGIIAILGVVEFRKANTTVDPRDPEKTSSLVVGGIYKVSRNPMYLGFLFLLIGWGIYLEHALSFIFVFLFVLYVNRFQIIPEERFMQSKYGPEYTAYKANVRRWL